MQVRVNKPELAKFVTDKVNAGQFASPEAVIEDALSRMMEDENTLSDDDRGAIKLADDASDEEFVDFDVFAAEMRRKYVK
jgi:Arc/MetJ-type ribon-helix-helix transcriptional regulator